MRHPIARPRKARECAGKGVGEFMLLVWGTEESQALHERDEN